MDDDYDKIVVDKWQVIIDDVTCDVVPGSMRTRHAWSGHVL